jgi:hypothetical protein
MPTLEEVAERMRAAVTSQAYGEAREIVPLYCELLECEFRLHSPASPEARRIAEEAKDLYQTLAGSVILDRAQCAMELQRLAGMASYLRSGARAAHTYEIEG